MRRLNQLEERLSRSTTATRSRQKLHTLPWWIVLLLGGGFAAAAWWAGEQWLERSGLLPVTTQMQSPVDDTMTSNEPDAVDRDSPSEGQTTTQDRDSSVIYQRENF